MNLSIEEIEKIKKLVFTFNDENIEIALQLCNGVGIEIIDIFSHELQQVYFEYISRRSKRSFIDWLKKNVQHFDSISINNHVAMFPIELFNLSFKRIYINNFRQGLLHKGKWSQFADSLEMLCLANIGEYTSGVLHFPSTMFQKFKKLHTLFIKNIPLNPFEGNFYIENLERLYIEEGHDTDLNELRFDLHKKLTHVSLNYPTTTLPQYIYKSNTISYLKVNVTEMSSDISNVTNLKSLDISQCWIDKIPAEIANCEQLCIINLEDNRYTKLPMDLLKNKNLQIHVSSRLYQKLPGHLKPFKEKIVAIC